MNISTLFVLFVISMRQIGFVAAQEVASPVGPGKPDHGASDRELGWWSTSRSSTWSSRSSKSSKSRSSSKSSKSWWSSSSWSGNSRKSRDWNGLREGHHNYRKKRHHWGNWRDLGQDEVEDEAQLKSDENTVRRWMNGGKGAHLAEQDP